MIRPGTDARDRGLLWVACIIVLALGIAAGGFRMEAAIDDQHERSESTAALLRADTQLLAAAGQIERAERHGIEELRAFDLHADHATLVGRFIRSCARITAAHHVQVEQIDERHADTTAGMPPRSATQSEDPFETIALDVTLRGSYRDLLAATAELARAPIAVRIDITTIERGAAEATGGAGPLDARLHVDILRLPDAAPTIPAHSPDSENAFHARSS